MKSSKKYKNLRNELSGKLLTHHIQRQEKTILDYFQYHRDILEILKNNGAKCIHSNSEKMEKMIEIGLQDAINNPAIIIEKKSINSGAPRAEETKIPYVLHQIWITSANKPREIREQDLHIIFNNKAIFDKASVAWEHILWTNNKSLIPNTIDRLENQGIKVKSIYNFKDNLKNFDLIESFILIAKWGVAVDTLKYSLIENFGGVYADLNYSFKKDITDEAHKYNLIATEDAYYGIHNNVFGATSHHLVTDYALEFIANNSQKCYPKFGSERYFTNCLTADAMTFAYYTQANKDGNIDVVYRGNNFRTPYDHRKYHDDVACPERISFYEFEKYLYNHHVKHEYLGEDGKDGMTWLITPELIV